MGNLMKIIFSMVTALYIKIKIWKVENIFIFCSFNFFLFYLFENYSTGFSSSTMAP